MNELTLIRHVHDHAAHGHHQHVRLLADRATLAKRRWRGVAQDGREFGFDLEEALAPGTHFYVEGERQYVLAQTPEEVLEIPLTNLQQAAHVAWSLGNLHFGVQLLPGSVRVVDDPAVLQLLSREKIAFKRVTSVFLPLSNGAHHHAHGHSHG